MFSQSPRSCGLHILSQCQQWQLDCNSCTCNSEGQIGLLSCPDLRDPYYSLYLVRSGCDSGGKVYVFYFFAFGHVWFPIRGSCLSLSLIGDHIWVVIFLLRFVWSCFLFSVFCLTEIFAFVFTFVILCVFWILKSWTFSTLRLGPLFIQQTRVVTASQ